MIALEYLLAGPIVRQVTADSLVVWVATVSDNPLKLQLFPVGADEVINFTHSDKVIQIGASCFLHYLTFSLSEGTLNEVSVWEYDVLMQHEEGPERSLLTDMGMRQFCLPGFRRPSVRIQRPGENLKIFAGSCRKMHASSEDAVFALRHALEHAKENERPHAMYLCGDQIYADDVSILIRAGIYSSGILARLFSADNRSPDYVSFEMLSDPAKNRNELINALSGEAGATLLADPASSGNHLVSWAEFAMMYLVTWSPRLLSHTLDNIDELRESASLIEATSHYQTIFANMSVFMLADDHECTDDWNFSDAWIKSVYTHSSLLADVVLHAELAYLLFQHAGNVLCDPSMQEMLNGLPNDFSKANNIADEVRERVATYRSEIGYTFRVDTDPPSLFIDTRIGRISNETRLSSVAMCTRIVKDNVGDSPPVFLERKNRAGRSFPPTTIAKVTKLVKGMPPTMLIVCPSPVLSLPSVDYGQSFATSVGLDTTVDNEGWMSNAQDFASLISTLANLADKTIIILSGDLHFAYSASAALSTKSKSLNVIQVVTSALKNEAASIPVALDNRLGSRQSYIAFSQGAVGGDDALIYLTEHDVKDEEDFNNILSSCPQMHPLRRTFGLTSHFGTIIPGGRRIIDSSNALSLTIGRSELIGTWITTNGSFCQNL